MKKASVAALLFLLAGASFCHAGNSLSRAAISGNLQEMTECLNSGEGVNDIDKWGWTALLWSVYYGNIPAADLLLEKGADPNLKSQKEYGSFPAGVTPLILAAYYGHESAVASLLKKKADPKVMDVKGKRAIDYAKEYGFTSIVHQLKGK